MSTRRTEPVSSEVTPLPPRRSASRIVRRLMLLLACLLMADAVFGEKGLLETRRAGRDFEELSGAIGSLRRENARLRAAARQLREDPGTLEWLARRELGLIRPGEVLVIVRDK